MSRRPPRVIRILGQRLTIDASNSHISEVVDGREQEGALTLLGYTDIDSGVIAISQHQGEDRKRETYLHEVIHATFSLMGIKRYIERPGDTDHEEVVALLGAGLLSVLRDNPTLVAYLTDRSPIK